MGTRVCDRLFGSLEERNPIASFRHHLAQGAILHAIVAARRGAGISQNLPDGDQAATAFRPAAQAAISINSRTRTAGLLGLERAREILVCQNTAGANDHGFNQKRASNTDHLNMCVLLVNARK
jgi:hypothetical protein